MNQADSLVIADRFRGPPLSGNGGYTAGVFAAMLPGDGPVEVTLRSPVPLDRPLQARRGEPLTIVDGDTLVAEVRRSELDLTVPAPPDWTEVRAAAASSYSLEMPFVAPAINGQRVPGRGFHPTCFCCGAEHDTGLHVFAAPVLGGEQVAAVWQTDTAWAQGDWLPAAFVWAALDCPGQFAFLAGGVLTGMLGRITAELHHPVRAGEAYLLTAWRARVEGKKHFAGTALLDRDGRVLARALSTWIGRRN